MRRLVTAVALVAAVLAVPASAAPAVWQPTLPVPDELRPTLSALADGTVVVGTAMFVYRSEDGGNSWTTLPPPPEPELAYPRFATRELGWSFGLSAVYLSTDGGQTWGETPALPSDGGRPAVTTSGVAEQSATVFVGGEAYRPEVEGCNEATGVIWSRHSLDGPWRRADLGLLEQPYQIRAYSPQVAAALAHTLTPDPDSGLCARPESTSVWLTNDGGASWRRVHECERSCTAVAMPRARRIVIGHNDGTTAVSEDAGLTWEAGQSLVEPELSGSPIGDGFFVQSLSFASPTVGFASTKGGGTWRTEDGGRNWTQELSADRVYSGIGAGEIDAIDAERAVISGLHAVSVRTRPAG